MSNSEASTWQRFRGRLSELFPFGLAPGIIVVMTVLSGGWLAMHPVSREQSSIEMWTFPLVHYDAYKAAAPLFEESRPGVTVDVQIVQNQAIRNRLRASLWSNADVPDLVEVESSYAGSFFRGPVEEVGFIDLTDRLKEDGLLDKLVQNRLAQYTNRGRIFGIPHDVHPVMLAYREDLVKQLGIVPEELTTWDKFIEEGKRVTRPGRYMIRLSDTGSHNYEMLLYQRGGNFFDANGQLIMDNGIALETLIWYIPLVAGEGKIGYDPGGGELFTRAVEDGQYLFFVCPDWRSKTTEKLVTSVAGKMRLMPLPAVEKGGRRTSVWGGTMLAITRQAKDKDLAWDFAKHIYFNPDILGKMFLETNILPPYKEAWKHPAFSQPRDYWGGQKIGEMYIGLAEDVPKVYSSPFLQLAKDKMANCIGRCAQFYAGHGKVDEEFRAYCREQMESAADDVRKQMQRNPF